MLCVGFEGGREAARQLVTQSYKGLKMSQPGQMIVHVFADVTSLATTLLQCGIISRQEIFHEFVNGFNSVGDLVTFVDVGRGKEVADLKVNGIRTLNPGSIRFDEDVRCYATMSKYYIGWNSR